METSLITLTTDFGHKDPFVGIMKGVIYGINPRANVIDLTHGIPAQDILAGALALRFAAPAFPPGTIHVAVVDPGVGSRRRPLLIECDGSLFLGPDNGLLSLAVEGKKIRRITQLSNELYHLKPTSTTFHGRDIFAPVAAYLSLGIAPADFGEEVDSFLRLEWPRPQETEGGLMGKVVYIDAFGNLITNIRESDLKAFNSRPLAVSVAGARARGLAASYSSAQGGYAAIINSWGLLEIFSFGGNAQQLSGAKLGDPVWVRQAEAQGEIA